VTVYVLCDQGRTESARFIGVLSMKESDFMALLIIQNWQINGAGDMVDLEFSR
jgi:hypothetical protein